MPRLFILSIFLLVVSPINIAFADQAGRTAGAIIGAIAGAFAGNQFGSGVGKTAATIGGGIAGLLVGQAIGDDLTGDDAKKQRSAYLRCRNNGGDYSWRTNSFVYGRSFVVFSGYVWNYGAYYGHFCRQIYTETYYHGKVERIQSRECRSPWGVSWYVVRDFDTYKNPGWKKEEPTDNQDSILAEAEGEEKLEQDLRKMTLAELIEAENHISEAEFGQLKSALLRKYKKEDSAEFYSELQRTKLKWMHTNKSISIERIRILTKELKKKGASSEDRLAIVRSFRNLVGTNDNSSMRNLKNLLLNASFETDLKRLEVVQLLSHVVHYDENYLDRLLSKFESADTREEARHILAAAYEARK